VTDAQIQFSDLSSQLLIRTNRLSHSNECPDDKHAHFDRLNPSVSSVVSLKTKSPGKREAFRLTCSLSRYVCGQIAPMNW
jgi:hypothetical protein